VLEEVERRIQTLGIEYLEGKGTIKIEHKK
jgi:hypothetical protein